MIVWMNWEDGLPEGEGEGCDDGGLFGEGCEGEEGCGPELGGEEAGAGVVGFVGCEVEGDGPEGEGGGEDIGVGEGALGEPDGVDGGEDGGDDGCGCAGEVASDAVDGEEGRPGDHADESAGSGDDESGEMPPCGEEDGWKGRVRVGDGGLGDEGSGAEEVPCSGDVVAALIPEVGEAEEGEVGEEDGDEEEGEEHPEGDVRSAGRGWAGCGLAGSRHS